MPSGKSKEDTWKSGDLEKQIRDAKDDRRKTRDKDKERERDPKRKDRHKEDVIDDKKHRSKQRDDDRHKDKDRDRDRDRRHRERENGESDKRERHKEKDRDRDRDRDRDKDKRRSKEDDRRKDDKERRKKRDEDPDDREKRHRRQKEENDEDRERRHRRHREEQDRDDRERRHRKQKETNGDDREKSSRRHRDEDSEDRERRHHGHRDEDGDRDKEQKHRKHRDGEDREDWHMKPIDDNSYYKDMFSPSGGNTGEEKEKKHRRTRDEDGDRKKKDDKMRRGDEDDRKRRHREDDEKRKRRDDDDKKHGRHRDGDEERKHKKREDETDEERRKRKEKEREKRRKEKEEEEKRKEEEEKMKNQRRIGHQKTTERYKQLKGQDNLRNQQEKVVDPIRSSSSPANYDYSDDFESYTSSDTAICRASSSHSASSKEGTSGYYAEKSVAQDGQKMAVPVKGISHHEYPVYTDEKELDGVMNDLKTAEDELGFTCKTDPETMVSQLEKVQNDMDAMFGSYDPILGKDDYLSIAIREVEKAQSKENNSVELKENSDAVFKLEDENNRTITTDLPSYVSDTTIKCKRGPLEINPKNDTTDQEPELSAPSAIDNAAGSVVLDVLRASLQKVQGFEQRLCSGIFRKIPAVKSVFKRLEPQTNSSESSVSIDLEKPNGLTPEPCVVWEPSQGDAEEILADFDSVKYPEKKDSTTEQLKEEEIQQCLVKGRKTGLWLQQEVSPPISDFIQLSDSKVGNETAPVERTPEPTPVVPFLSSPQQTATHEDQSDNILSNPSNSVNKGTTPTHDNSKENERCNSDLQISAVKLDKPQNNSRKLGSQLVESTHPDESSDKTEITLDSIADPDQSKKNSLPLFEKNNIVSPRSFKSSSSGNASSLKLPEKTPLIATGKPARSPTISPANSPSPARSPAPPKSPRRISLNTRTGYSSKPNPLSPKKKNTPKNTLKTRSPRQKTIHAKITSPSTISAANPYETKTKSPRQENKVKESALAASSTRNTGDKVNSVSNRSDVSEPMRKSLGEKSMKSPLELTQQNAQSRTECSTETSKTQSSVGKSLDISNVEPADSTEVCVTGSQQVAHLGNVEDSTSFELEPQSSSLHSYPDDEKKKEAAADDDYNYDDDDFEDYDDDFEDDDGDSDNEDDDDDEPAQKDRPTDEEEDDDDPYNLSLNSAEQIQTLHSPGNYKSYVSGWVDDPDKFNSEMDEILQAMNDENDRLIAESRKDTWSDSTEDDRERNKPKSAPNRTFINFVSAKQRTFSDKVANKARRRGVELQQIIEFDVTSYDLFDMPPVKEYDMYIRTFGSSNTKQAYVQTNDDNIDRELQTEDIDCRDKWCQHPPDDVAGCGGEGDDGEDASKREEKPIDSVKLGKFLAASCQVIAVLIEEDFADRVQTDLSRKQSNICVSDAYVQLEELPLLKGRHVVASKFSSVQTHLLLTAYSPGTDKDLISQRGIVCMWNVNEPSKPQKVLMCESLPRCCCFSPLKSTLTFAGMSDGSLAVWDLREASTIHKTHHDGKGDWVLRYPTYNTAGVLHYENHGSAIVSVCPIVASSNSSSSSTRNSSSSESGEGLSFQLATLEENSQIHLWVVAEINNPDMAGSESDLGLVPGGRVKLIKSSAILLESPLRDPRFRTTMQCFDMQLLPSNNSHYYVTSNMGCISHGVRYGGKAPPKAYRAESDALVNVTSIDFSPFTEPVFLAGCEDGSLRLYHIDGEYPLIIWPSATDGHPIQMVRWCRSRPSVFFVLDNRSCIYIWDLNMDDAVPLKEEQISRSRVTSFCLSNDHSATGIGMAGRRPQMVVCLEDGSIEVHTISKEFSALMTEEVDQFAAFLQKIA